MKKFFGVLFLFSVFFIAHAQTIPALFPQKAGVPSLANGSFVNLIGSQFKIDSIHANLSGTVDVHILKYDDVGNVIVDSVGYYGNQWTKTSRYTWTYVLGNQIDTFTIERWNAGGYWMKYYLVDYEYNSAGLLSSFISKAWNGTWQNRFWYIVSYDSLMHLSSTRYSMWVDADSAWKNVEKAIYMVDSVGTVDTIEVYSWFSNEWTKEGQFVFTYDDAGNLTIQLFNNWSMDEFHPYSRTIYEYNANNMKTLELDQRFTNDGYWSDQTKKTYEFNEDNVITHGESYEWDGFNGEWKPSLSTFHAVAPNGAELCCIAAFSFDTFFSEVTNAVAKVELPARFELNQNYPNPFNPTTRISYSIPTFNGKQSLNVTLNVYNTLGQKVATLVNKAQAPGNYSVQFNASNLPSGVYFYKLQAGNFTSTKKMILMK